MTRLFIILFALLLAKCKEKNTKGSTVAEGTTTIQGIRKECKVAAISFYKDLASTPLVLKPAKGKRSIDTVFSLIGKNTDDTGCRLNTSFIPIGKIDFYSDSLITDNILSLWFSLSDSCVFLYDEVDGPPTYELTTFGKTYLLEQEEKVPKQWKK